MVILSVSLVTKKGKILMARQYVPMSRLRIEGLLAAFPKLVFSENNSGSKQHTFVETDEVRYIYQPMDMLYLLLITNMQSNILEDLSTLRTIAKLIPDYCQGHDEAAIEERAFDLIFAVDEVVSPLGYREQVNYKQIEDYTKMDSAEAKLTEIIQTSKEENAKQLAKEKEKQFDEKRKRELKMHGGSGLGGRLGSSLGVDLSSLGGIRGGPGSSGGGGIHGGGISSDQIQFNNNNVNETIEQHGDTNKYNDNDSSSDDNSNNFGKSRNKFGRKNSKKSKKKKSGQRSQGLKLGAMSKAQDKLFDDVSKADSTLIQTKLVNSSLLSGNAGVSSNNNNNDMDTSHQGPMNPVEINVIEKLTIQLDRDNVIKKFEVRGDMEVVVNQPEAGSAKFEITKSNKVDGFGKINWRLHPRIDNSSFKQNILMLKDESKVFKMGRNAKTSILKWRMNTTDDDMIPIRINFWPENDGGEISVSVNYSIDRDDIELSNVIVTLPTPTSSDPEVSKCDGQYTFYKRENELQWNLGDLATGDEGSFEYVLDDVDIDELWPIAVHFEMQTTYLQIQVNKVSSRQTDEEFEFAAKYMCVADGYSIE